MLEIGQKFGSKGNLETLPDLFRIFGMVGSVSVAINFEYEKAIADMNRMLAPDIETIFLTCSPVYSTISSTLVRDVIRNNGNARMFLPEEVRF